MTHPNTEHDDSTQGGPPEYPSSQQLPPEFWRQQPVGDPGNGQYISIETADGLVKRPVEPGWDKPVIFSNHLTAGGS